MNLIRLNMAYAMISALVMVLISGSIGLFIRSKIWGLGNKPSSPIQYGRAWAAYVAFIVPLSSIHLFAEKDIVNASVQFLIAIIFFPLFTFILGFTWGKFKGKSKIESYKVEGSKPLTDSPVSKVSVLVIAGLIVVIGVALITYSITNTKNEKWMPVSNAIFKTLGASNSMIEYLDFNSIKRDGGYYTAYIAEVYSLPILDGARTIKEKLQVDCAAPKYRISERYTFTKLPEDGFGKVISSDVDVQSSRAKMASASGEEYSGGWVRFDKLSVVCEELPTEGFRDFCSIGKAHLATLNAICNITN